MGGPDLVKLALWDGERLIGQRMVNVEIAVYRDVLVADTDLERHAVLGEDNLKLERCDVYETESGTFTELEDILGFRARHIIPAGRVILGQDIERIPLIERGDSVTLSIVMGGITVSATGRALDEGTEGDVIAVRNERSGRLLMGRIVGKGEVSVELRGEVAAVGGG